MLRKLFLALVAAVVGLSGCKCDKAGAVDEAKVKEIVKAYLVENPEVIKEALNAAAVKEEQERNAKRLKVVEANREALELDPTTPIIGNPNGDITVVEFFDYNCGFCKMMFPKVYEFVKNDGNIRWVLKDMPSLGETSRTAALAGLAAAKQGKYFEMHQALITHKGALTDEDIKAKAKEIGLDMKKFEQDKKDPEFSKVIDNNYKLANKLEFRGIPDFIIGDFVSNGAMMGDELEENVTRLRNK